MTAHDDWSGGQRVQRGGSQRQGNQGERQSRGLPNYVDVAERVDKFWREMRETKTPARIETEIVDRTDKSITVKAMIYMHFQEIGWVRVADGLAEDMRASAPQGKCLEVAQTSAVGRALALAGYSHSARIASKDEMESYYAAQEAEAREKGVVPMTPAAEVSPEAVAKALTDPTPIKKPQTMKSEQSPAPAKVAVTSDKGTTRGATVQEATAAQAQLAPVQKGQTPGPTPLHDQAIAAAIEGKPDDAEKRARSEARLKECRPAFRVWLDKRWEDAEAGKDFEAIKAVFSDKKKSMTEIEQAEAKYQLGRLKERCDVIASADYGVDPALAAEVATELEELTEEERAYMLSGN